MQKDDLIKLHMLDSAKEAISFTAGKVRSDLDIDRMLALSLIKSIEIIGEAASRTSKEIRCQYPQIPWMDIITMRNRLIHAYFDINLDILWNTVTQDLPPLILELGKINFSDETL
jgi:uncharacterized protein with HEPN domain